MTSMQQAFTKARAEWKELEDSRVPVFFVGSATCGRAAGATEVLERLRSHIKEKGIDAVVVEVGCLGPCSFEPLVIVHKSGAPRICYGNVGPDEIIRILENHVLGDEPCADEIAPEALAHGRSPRTSASSGFGELSRAVEPPARDAPFENLRAA